MSLLVNLYPKKQLVICRSLTYIHVATITLLFATSFLVNPDFFNSLITAKQWGLEQVLLLTAFSLVVSLPFVKTIHFSIIDLLVLVFGGWHILSEVYVFHSPYISLSDTIFTVAIWLTVYLFVRSAAQQPAFVWAIVIVWMVVSLMQSGLGLIQLYGLESSYHGLFSITGTFHNPGPFSGFVVSGLPIALGVIGYIELTRKRGYTEVKGENTENHRGNNNNNNSIKLSVSNVLSVQPIGKNKRKPLCSAAHASSSDSLQTKIERRLCDKDKDLKEFGGHLYQEPKLFTQGSDTIKSLSIQVAVDFNSYAFENPKTINMKKR